MGLCPPLLLVGHLTHSCCSINIKCALSPAEQACTIFNTHIILLDNLMLPNHGYSKQQLISSILLTFFNILCMHTPILVTTTQGCHCPHIRLAHPPPTSWPCAILTPLLHHPGQLQMSICVCTHTCAPDLGQQPPSSINISIHPWLGSH